MSTLSLVDTELYFEDAGQGPALLFLHGLGTSGRVWGAQQAEFVHDHRVVTVDWRGCGRSDRPAAGHDHDTVVNDVAALIETLGLDRPVTVGSSLGAVFATELAVTRPELVGGVVAVDGPAFWAAEQIDLAGLGGQLRDRRAEVVGQWVPDWFAAPAPQALIDWTVAAILDATPYLGEQFEALVGYDPRPRLPGLSVPIHYLHGERDTQVPPQVAVQCAALTPGAGVSVVSAAGHLPHQERPVQFNAALRAALRSMSAA